MSSAAEKKPAPPRDDAAAEGYALVLDRLQAGSASSQDLQMALAYQMKLNVKMAAQLQTTAAQLDELQGRILKPREERPDDDQDLKATPAMVEEAMRRNARNARISRAAKRSGFDKGDWVSWCEKHDRDPTKSIKTERAGSERDDRQTQLKLTATPSRTKRSRPKSATTKQKAKKRRKGG